MPHPRCERMNAVSSTHRAPSRAGRKRDPTRDVAILDATLRVLAESGYANLTIDSVAAAAGAGKATVYRRWPTKTALVLDALAQLDAGALDPSTLPDTGSLRGDLHALLLPQGQAEDEQRLRVMAGVTLLLADDPALAEAADAVVVGPWAAANRAIIERAVDRGEIEPIPDVDLLARVVPTMAAYRVSIQRKTIPNDFIASLIDAVLLPALGVRP